jgi:diguanylate cyclase (GGDEF)-like protein
LTGQVFKTKRHCYIPDTRKEPRYLYYKGEKTEDGSFLGIPLLYKDNLVGILNFTRPGVDSFSGQEIQFLNTVAVVVAIALVNARLYSRTRDLSIRDDLTRLYNRRHLQEVLPLEIKRAQRFHQTLSLLMIDIDQFKRFNDSFGHLEGDKRLREIAGLMSGKIREVDFMARFGGEEFVVILANTPKQDGIAVAEKLRNLVRTCPFELDCPDPEHQFTISIGVAAYPDDADQIETLLHAADQALYQAKGAGRDRVIPFSAPPSPVADPANTVSSSPDFSTGRRGEKSA